MKITPIAGPTMPTIDQQGQSSSNRPTIKMNVNQTINKTPFVLEENAELDAQSPNLDDNETAHVVEEKKPLSPQLAAIAKAKRALQVKERELAEREARLSQTETKTTSQDDLIARLKANPLSVLQENGVSYDDLTQAILNNPQSPEINQLKNELKSLKEEFTQTLSERDKQAETQVLAQMKREAEVLSREGDAYQFIREAGMIDDVIEGIKDHYYATGEVADLVETMNKLESKLIDNAVKAAQLEKVKAKLNPASSEASQPEIKAPVQQGIRTLTARDTARPTSMDRKSRALAAFYGQLKK